MPDCSNCYLKERVKKLEEDFSTHSERTSNARKQIYTRLEALERASAVADERFKQILDEIKKSNEEIEKISKQIEDLSNQPAKRWDKAVITTITTIVGAFVGYIASKIFGG